MFYSLKQCNIIHVTYFKPHVYFMLKKGGILLTTVVLYFFCNKLTLLCVVSYTNSNKNAKLEPHIYVDMIEALQPLSYTNLHK